MRALDDVSWKDWRPVDVATLVFVVDGARILLIHKKRGLGAGKINGPGGRVEAGESVEACAVREVQEELCVTPTGLRWGGENRFQFVDGYSIHAHVFRADGFEGTPTETDEAVPLWVDLSKIPYERMWEDDILWLPLLLEGKPFSARYLFDDDVMLGHAFDPVP